MGEPLQGQKTNILAGVYVLLQGAKAAGFLTEAEATLAEQALAVFMGATLALKARRASKGK